MSVTIAVPAPSAVSIALIWIALGAAIAGTNPILARLSEVGPVATAGWRMGVAALALAPFVLGRGRLMPGLRGFGALGLAGLLFAIDLAFFHLSLARTSVAHATLIVNMAPLIALAAGFLLFRERLGLAKLAGLVLAIGGAALMTAGRSGTAGTLEGNALAALAMLGYAFYLVAVKGARREHDAVAVMFWSSAVAAVALFAGAAVLGETLAPRSASGLGILLANGLVTHLLGQGLIALGMGAAPVGLGSILMLTQPVVAALLAWAIFAETLGLVELTGALVVLGGLVTASRARQ